MDNMTEDFYERFNLSGYRDVTPTSSRSGDDEIWHMAPSKEESPVDDHNREERPAGGMPDENPPSYPKVFESRVAAGEEARNWDKTPYGPISIFHEPHHGLVGLQKFRQYVLHLHPDVIRRCQMELFWVAPSRYINILKGPTGQSWIVKPYSILKDRQGAFFAWFGKEKGWSTHIMAETIAGKEISTKETDGVKLLNSSKTGKKQGASKTIKAQPVSSKTSTSTARSLKVKNGGKGKAEQTTNSKDKKRKRTAATIAESGSSPNPEKKRHARYPLHSVHEAQRSQHLVKNILSATPSDGHPNGNPQPHITSLTLPTSTSTSTAHSAIIAANNKALIHFYMSDQRFGTMTHSLDACSNPTDFFKCACNAYAYTSVGDVEESRMGSVSVILHNGDIPKLILWRNPVAFDRFLAAAKRELFEKGTIDVRVRCHYKP